MKATEMRTQLLSYTDGSKAVMHYRKTHKLSAYKGKDRQWRWHMHSSNAENISDGEGYTRLNDLLEMLRGAFPLLAQITVNGKLRQL